MPRRLLCTWLILLGAAYPTASDGDRTDPSSPDRPGASLAVVLVQSYRMSGAIRPLLFWISSDRVGAGRIVWRQGADGARAYELLIGSDPAFAPRKLNRWGYLAEEVRGTTGSMLGLISADDQDTLAGVTADGVDQLPEAVFKTIRATVRADASEAEIATLGVAEALTFHDVEIGLELMRRASNPDDARVAARPAGARSGFLAAMSEILRDTVRDLTDGSRPARPTARSPLTYVYGDGLHDLTVRSTKFHARRAIGRRTYPDVIHAKFETRSRRTGTRRRFEVIYGTSGELAEVPIWMRYQPRWWLRVDLTLEDGDALAGRPHAAPHAPE